MAGRILIIDTVATNRIVLKVKLASAQYQVTPCANVAEAREAMNEGGFDLCLIEMTQLPPALREFCQDLRDSADTGHIPIIATGYFDSSSQRLDALICGADDVLEKPMSDQMLLARIRSLLRARAADDELRLRDDTSRALGFSEATEVFVAAGAVTLIAAQPDHSTTLCRELGAALAASVQQKTPEDVLMAQGNVPDLFIIDARGFDPDTDDRQLFRLIADLRSRSDTRHAAQLLITPSAGSDLSPMALDVGANDVVPSNATAAEIGLRARKLIRRKQRMAQLRDTVQTGLKAAVTDPLTGLYNRRYAIPHLRAMAERSKSTGRSFAVMALDIDHFKLVNDSFGHSAGDRVIAGVAEILRDNLRSVDLVARIGGEEFLIALPDTPVDQARKMAERIRDIVQNTPLSIGAGKMPVGVTLSIGVALGTGDDCDVTDVVERADAALYDSKSSGRNAVTFARTAA